MSIVTSHLVRASPPLQHDRKHASALFPPLIFRLHCLWQWGKHLVMKLFYYQDKIGNFGDDLNPWLWDRLLPGIFDDDPSELFVGIGTLLNQKLPAGPRKHIFGSGFGYGSPPIIDDTFVFHAVRGPHTAKILNIDTKFVLTDPAILIRTIDVPKAPHTLYKFGFVPHHLSENHFHWGPLCASLNIHYIYPSKDIDHVLLEISKCETLLCEAMHGAIIADALRIPWIPVICYDHIDALKWIDWLSTVNIHYDPIVLPALYENISTSPFYSSVKYHWDKLIYRTGLRHKNPNNPPPRNSAPRDIQTATECILQATTQPACLSDITTCDMLTQKYLSLIEYFLQMRGHSS